MAEITLIEQSLGIMFIPSRSLHPDQKDPEEITSWSNPGVLRTIKYCKGLVQSKVEEKKDEKKEAA